MDSPRIGGGASVAAKLTAFDAVRGGAAVIVFTGHYFRNFAPDFERSVNGTIFYTLFNGSAAVVVFFVLSGFVLSRRPLLTGKISVIVFALEYLHTRVPPIAHGELRTVSFSISHCSRFHSFSSQGCYQRGPEGQRSSHDAWNQAGRFSSVYRTETDNRRGIA